ncbi:helix-turn-helix domain-containing protein [Fictibacillus aquaticus]|uniref:helix-turn-helix domain-containing protein n=1 Tax=Fictibacillus aquaticus TaxID=2021314 RepID=UPI0013FDB2D2|nr:helix-turn-helix domain-containing protein [Fictibacillus aquaticus]
MNLQLGKTIKTLRLSKGFNVTRLAAAAGISKSYLSSIETQRTNPSAHVLQKIAGALGVPVERLIYESVEPLDPEWTELLKQAKEMGIEKEDIRTFISYETWKNNGMAK